MNGGRPSVMLVCGLGRCGTSLVMQMLDAGGMPVVGRFPAYEEFGSWFGIEHEVVCSFDRKAMKVLDPHLMMPVRGPTYRGVWLDRDLVQQAMSQVKFFAATMPLIEFDETDATTRVAAALKQDRKRALVYLRRIGMTPVVMSFEAILADPRTAATTLNDLAGGGLDQAAMARAVRPRDPGCLVGLLEHDLLREAHERIASHKMAAA